MLHINSLHCVDCRHRGRRVDRPRWQQMARAAGLGSRTVRLLPPARNQQRAVGVKVVQLKEAKASIERKRYGALVLAEFDRQEREAKKPLIEKRAEIERKAKKAM